jgi:hypothetical protein
MSATMSPAGLRTSATASEAAAARITRILDLDVEANPRDGFLQVYDSGHGRASQAVLLRRTGEKIRDPFIFAAGRTQDQGRAARQPQPLRAGDEGR